MKKIIAALAALTLLSGLGLATASAHGHNHDRTCTVAGCTAAGIHTHGGCDYSGHHAESVQHHANHNELSHH